MYECFNISDIIAASPDGLGSYVDGDDVALLAIEPALNADTAYLVHHFILYEFESPCNGLTSTQLSQSEKAGLVFAWAPGSTGFVYPETPDGDATARIIEGDRVRAFIMETHYDNPNLIPIEYDNSGLKVSFKTENLNAYVKVGILELGNPKSTLKNRVGTLPEGVSEMRITCRDIFEDLPLAYNTPVEVFGQQLHMHKAVSGAEYVNYRGNNVAQKTLTQFYDFAFQDLNPMSTTNYQIKRGDTSTYSCFYDTKNAVDPNGVKFGLVSSEEMCTTFIYYYPRVPGAAEYEKVGLYNLCDWELIDLNDQVDAVTLFEDRTFGLNGCELLTTAHPTAAGTESSESQREELFHKDRIEQAILFFFFLAILGYLFMNACRMKFAQVTPQHHSHEKVSQEVI